MVAGTECQGLTALSCQHQAGRGSGEWHVALAPQSPPLATDFLLQQGSTSRASPRSMAGDQALKRLSLGALVESATRT